MNKEIIGYKLKERIEGFKTNVGDICKDSKYFPLYKDHPKFEPIYKEETIPEYIECTRRMTSVKVGTIYPVDKKGIIINDPNYPYSWNGRGFTPSTKEAYDLQNPPKFEVGKWYKIEAYKAYFKFKSITTKYGFDEVNYFDCIWNGGTLKSNNSIFNTRATNSAVLLTDLSEIQQYLPDDHPDKIVKEFVLPEIFWVRVTEENKDVLAKWRFDGKPYQLIVGQLCGMSMSTWGTKLEKGHNAVEITQGTHYTFGNEITFEQFKKYVLKEVDWSKATKEELLAEAKRRYPIGTKYYIPINLSYTKVSSEITGGELIFGGNDNIYGSNYQQFRNHDGCVYYKGVWAEIIETPKEASYTPGMRTPDIGPYYGKTELFSKEQLEAINKMIDDKIKMLE